MVTALFASTIDLSFSSGADQRNWTSKRQGKRRNNEGGKQETLVSEVFGKRVQKDCRHTATDLTQTEEPSAVTIVRKRMPIGSSKNMRVWGGRRDYMSCVIIKGRGRTSRDFIAEKRRTLVKERTRRNQNRRKKNEFLQNLEGNATVTEWVLGERG